MSSEHGAAESWQVGLATRALLLRWGRGDRLKKEDADEGQETNQQKEADAEAFVFGQAHG